MRYLVLFTSLVLLSFNVFASPVYLDCQVSSDTESKKFSIKLDEGTGKITHTRPDGSAFNADGFFAANTISYQNMNGGGYVKITIKYKINRTDLTVQESFTIEPSDPKFAAKYPAKTTRMGGECRVVEVKNRKI